MKNKKIINYIVAGIMLAVLVVVLVLVNVDFSKKIFIINQNIDRFTTKLYNNQEYDLTSSTAKAKMLYFYDEFDTETFNEINDIINEDIEVVLISKYDDREEYSSLINENFSDSNLIFGYDSVNQTEIGNFTLDISYPYIVIIDRNNNLIVSEQNTYNRSYYSNYLNILSDDNIVIGSEIGNLCFTQDIRLINYNSTDYTESSFADDETINLRDYRGKIVILNFWYFGCGPCQREMPDFNEIANKYSDEVVVITVSNYGLYLADIEGTRNFVLTTGYNFVWAYDNSDEGYTRTLFGANAQAYPMTMILDLDGFITAKRVGSTHLEDLEAEIAKILG